MLKNTIRLHVLSDSTTKACSLRASNSRSIQPNGNRIDRFRAGRWFTNEERPPTEAALLRKPFQLDVGRDITPVVAGPAIVPLHFDVAIGRDDGPAFFVFQLINPRHTASGPPTGCSGVLGRTMSHFAAQAHTGQCPMNSPTLSGFTARRGVPFSWLPSRQRRPSTAPKLRRQKTGR